MRRSSTEESSSSSSRSVPAGSFRQSLPDSTAHGHDGGSSPRSLPMPRPAGPDRRSTEDHLRARRRRHAARVLGRLPMASSTWRRAPTCLQRGRPSRDPPTQIVCDVDTSGGRLAGIRSAPATPSPMRLPALTPRSAWPTARHGHVHGGDLALARDARRAIEPAWSPPSTCWRSGVAAPRPVVRVAHLPDRSRRTGTPDFVALAGRRMARDRRRVGSTSSVGSSPLAGPWHARDAACTLQLRSRTRAAGSTLHAFAGVAAIRARWPRVIASTSMLRLACVVRRVRQRCADFTWMRHFLGLGSRASSAVGAGRDDWQRAPGRPHRRPRPRSLLPLAGPGDDLRARRRHAGFTILEHLAALRRRAPCHRPAHKPVALHPYVEEDHEAQDQRPPQEGQPRQQAQRRPGLTADLDPRRRPAGRSRRRRPPGATTSSTSLHGVEVADPFRWLEDGDDPETRAWVDAQNDRTEPVLDALPGRAELHDRLSALLRAGSSVACAVAGDRVFSLERWGHHDQAVLVVRPADAPGRGPHAWSTRTRSPATRPRPSTGTTRRPTAGSSPTASRPAATSARTLHVARRRDRRARSPTRSRTPGPRRWRGRPTASAFAYTRYPDPASVARRRPRLLAQGLLAPPRRPTGATTSWCGTTCPTRRRGPTCRCRATAAGCWCTCRSGGAGSTST